MYKVEGVNISSNQENSGMVRVQLLKNTQISTALPPDAITLDLLADQVKVPDDDTTYWCHVHKLPAELIKKHHVLQVIPIKQFDNDNFINLSSTNLQYRKETKV